MRMCWCSLAGTDACKNCNVPDYSEINSINKRFTGYDSDKWTYDQDKWYKVFKDLPTKDTYEDLENLKKELEDCKKDHCSLCKRQKMFDSNWCKECRWADNE